MRRFIIFSLVVFFTNSFYAFGDYGGGTGEPNDPYLIYTAEQLDSIAYDVNGLSKCFKLMADIDLSAYSLFDPNFYRWFHIIGNTSYPFTGVFDGNWHTISNFTYYDVFKNYVGVFGYVKGRIKNLGIKSTSIYASNYIGALAGLLEGDGELICCWSDGGSIHGSSYTGGLVGYIGSASRGGTILNCWSSVAVNGQSYVGGLIGYLVGPAGEEQYASMMINCYADGNVTGTNCVGGLVGADAGPYGSLFYNCYSSGHVSGSYVVGGLVGSVPYFPYFSGCFWDTEASGTIDGVGNMEPDPSGVSGKTTAQMQTQSTFTNAGWDFVGELDNGPSDDWAMPAGGGYPVMWYHLSPWPALPSFTAGSGTAKDPYQITTELEMRSIGHNSRLMDKHFVLAADLTMPDVNFPMIGNDFYPFIGNFNGNNRTVSNLKCRGGLLDAYVGLFSIAGEKTGTGAEIANLNLENVDVNGGTVPTGALAGQMYFGEVKNCHVKDGKVCICGYEPVSGLVGIALGCDISKCSTKGISLSGDYFIGGLIGITRDLTPPYLDLGITYIRECSSNCSIRGQGCIGGLAGYALSAEIYDSYSKGDVNSEYVAGGFLGTGSLSNRCYSSALVTGPGTNGGFAGYGRSSEHYEGCFWDVNVNPALPGVGGYNDSNLIGETTEHMKMQSTYTNACWDFVNETTNGKMDIWFGPVNGYPKLYWEAMAGDGNYDGTVNIYDLDLLCSWWLIRQSDLPANQRLLCDFNFDGVVNFGDFSRLAANWQLNASYELTGSGKELNPYLITSLTDFDEFAGNPSYWNDYVRLETDINLAGRTYATAIIAPDINSVTSGFQGIAFTGSFDGNGHKISNVRIDTAGNSKDYLGLFGRLDGSAARVKNLGIDNAVITGGTNSNYLGALCGDNYGTISNCYTTGSVSGYRYLGGLCGDNYGTINDCNATGQVTGGANSLYLGGLCGYNQNGTISNCSATGQVTGGVASGFLGGLCGRNGSGTISNSCSTGQVAGSDYSLYLGGLCGLNYSGVVSNCCAASSVSGSQNLGGLCGCNTNSGTVSNCYAAGQVSGGTNSQYLGGLCGRNSSSIISNCYSTGSITGYQYKGGFCGSNNGSVAGCFWDVNTSGMDTSSGGTGLTTDLMLTQSTFTDAGWDYVDEVTNGIMDIWYQPANSYPKLSWQGDPD